MKKVAEKWKIWDEKEEVAKSEEKAKKLFSQRFYKWIHIFVLRKEKVYPLFREEREEVYKFIQEQLRKWYIRPLKLSQMVSLFFVGKNTSKKRLVQNYIYLNKWAIKNN